MNNIKICIWGGIHFMYNNIPLHVLSCLQCNRSPHIYTINGLSIMLWYSLLPWEPLITLLCMFQLQSTTNIPSKAGTRLWCLYSRHKCQPVNFKILWAPCKLLCKIDWILSYRNGLWTFTNGNAFWSSIGSSGYSGINTFILR